MPDHTLPNLQAAMAQFRTEIDQYEKAKKREAAIDTLLLGEGDLVAEVLKTPNAKTNITSLSRVRGPRAQLLEEMINLGDAIAHRIAELAVCTRVSVRSRLTEIYRGPAGPKAALESLEKLLKFYELLLT